MKNILIENPQKKNRNQNNSPDCRRDIYIFKRNRRFAKANCSGNLLKFFDWKPFLRFKRRKGCV